MKIYSCPEACPVPETDYRNYDYDKELKKEAEHQAALKIWLHSQGYTGKNTGKVVLFPAADGHAIYMLAEGGRKSILIHLPYGDAWQYPDAAFLPKKEILSRIKLQEMWDAEYAKQ
jgi:hypothetical protein